MVRIQHTTTASTAYLPHTHCTHCHHAHRTLHTTHTALHYHLPHTYTSRTPHHCAHHTPANAQRPASHCPLSPPPSLHPPVSDGRVASSWIQHWRRHAWPCHTHYATHRCLRVAYLHAARVHRALRVPHTCTRTPPPRTPYLHLWPRGSACILFAVSYAFTHHISRWVLLPLLRLVLFYSGIGPSSHMIQACHSSPMRLLYTRRLMSPHTLHPACAAFSLHYAHAARRVHTTRTRHAHPARMPRRTRCPGISMVSCLCLQVLG